MYTENPKEFTKKTITTNKQALQGWKKQDQDTNQLHFYIAAMTTPKFN